MPEPLPPVASTQATGNAGGLYEQHVGAACLATLLTGGMALLLPDAELIGVYFQTERLHWETDDLLLVGVTQSGQERRVALQAKRTLYWRKGDEHCVQTITDAWRDFQNSSLFDPQTDRIGIVVGQTNQKLSKGVRNLIDMARSSSEAQAFMRRLALPQHVSSDARDGLETLREVLDEVQGNRVTDDLIWSFLRILDFVILDFDTPSSSAETLVKSLLAATRNEASGTGTDTWNSLLAIAGEAASSGGDIRWADLPLELRNRHSRASAVERGGLTILEANTNVVRSGADAKIGGSVALVRGEVSDSILAALADNQAVVVTGEAGCGKSVVACRVFDTIRASGLALAFRAETLAEPHIATSLVGIGAGLKDVIRLFALHPRKVLWIESAERLLEKDAAHREAFGDLLRLFTQASGWKLLITCREYSVETFRSTFLERAGHKSEVVSVPGLADDELDEVQQHIRALALPLSQPVLRKLARNPFYLNLQARITWDPAALPTSLRAFRELAWRQVVRRQDEVALGMPLERERAMTEIAVRRARALTPFVNADGIAAAPLQALERDSLILSDPSDRGRYAPAHDVYEDWALLLWINRLHENLGAINQAFFDQLQTHPAMRRAFRRWLTELLEYETTEGDRRMDEILSAAAISQHWKDDALVAMLQSNVSGAFLTRSGAQLLGGNVSLLRRAVHLLRVACCKTPPGIERGSRLATTIMIPSGPAWDTMPEVVEAAVSRFNVGDLPWLLRFLEECVSRLDKDPSSDAPIGRLAKLLLANIENFRYQQREQLKERILRVMLSVPRAVETELRGMLDAALSNEDGRRRRDNFPKLIWGNFSGEKICRYFPDMTLRVAEHWLELIPPPEQEMQARRRFSTQTEVENIFGFHGVSSMDGYPASAWQGPFANLLKNHPEMGIHLIIRLLNRACESYSEFEQDLIEDPALIELIMEDQTIVEQWGNDRLWVAYRGQSVMPHVLESALMALEEWLLNLAERGDPATVTTCLRIIRESNNVALTGVVASIAVAHPSFFGEGAIPLLTSPALFYWDFNRGIQDSGALGSAMESIFPSTGADEMIFELERRESRKKTHRWQHLEYLCIQLQLTEAREKVWGILDEYGSELPPLEEQDENTRLWRLRLFRMDVRNFVGTPIDRGVLWQAGNFPEELEQLR